MADEYKRQMNKRCDKGGGLKCPCCNPLWKGKKRRLLMRLARREIQRETAKIIISEII